MRININYHAGEEYKNNIYVHCSTTFDFFYFLYDGLYYEFLQ